MSLLTPTPDEVRAARKAAGLTQTQASQVVGPAGDGGFRTWQRYEAPLGTSNHRDIHPGIWELFLLLTNQHPALEVTNRHITGKA
jgi:hypothetical protein